MYIDQLNEGLGCIFEIKMMMKICLGVIRFQIGGLFEKKEIEKIFECITLLLPISSISCFV